MAKPPPKHAGPSPVIAGTPRVGETLTASDGGWSGGPSGYGKQWVRDSEAIEGATGTSYKLVEADEGHMILVGANASNSAGTSETVYSAPVGPIQPVAVIPPEPGPQPPEPGPEPPPSGDVPASITAPVVGTPIPHVWALKDSGTGARDDSYPNGKWTGEIDSYLASIGFVRGNYDNALFCDAGDADLLVEGYDFNDTPRINWLGRKRLTVRDCRYRVGGPTWPTDLNNNIQFSGSTLEMIHEFCEFDVSAPYQGCGVTRFDHCKMTNQKQGFCDVSGAADTLTTVEYIDCYIPGGGVEPAWAAHVELMRWASEPNPEKFVRWIRCMVDVSACGQANAANYGGGWTGVWSIGDVLAEFEDCVMIGGPAINASLTVPNTMGCVVAYGERYGAPGPKLTNCVLEPGCYGYSYNHTGGSATRCVDGGGNRSLQNEALSVTSFASITRAEAERINPVLAALYDRR